LPHRWNEPDQTDRMIPYAGRYAELYDLFYADKPYAEEAAFVDVCLRGFGSFRIREILELACGTGRHAFELEKYHYEITATDRSSDMLEVARRHAAENDSKVVFVASDMQNLQAPAKEYDAVICLFDSIGYLKTDQFLSEALAQIWNRLRTNGLFVFEFWHAPAMLTNYSPLRLRRWKTPDREIVRISETTLDSQNQLANVDYTVYELKDDGTYSTFSESHTNRYFSVDEMQALISAANFEPLKFFAGFNKTESIDENTWHVVAAARKVSLS
jgi:SAM-dependent methyltransferase